MKKLLIIVVLFLFNCSSNESTPEVENVELLGKWKIIEQLIDSGDGSGTFQPINSDRVFEFFSNGKVTANGQMCYLGSSQSSESSSGTYEIIEDSNIDSQFEGTIFPQDCDFAETKISFNLTLDGHLILWYLCFEGCGEKYEKIN